MLFAMISKAQEYGLAAYYSDEFQNRKTASGELYDKNELSAAHKSLPFGTILKVTRLDNKKSVRVRVNDRGPYIKGRIIDVSRKAANRLSLVADGEAKVKIEVVDRMEENSKVSEATPETTTTPPPAEKPAVTEYANNTSLPLQPPPSEKKEVITKAEEISVPAPKVTTEIEKGAPPSKAKYVNLRDYKTYDLYKIQVMRPEKTGYAVQVASMSQYENMMKKVAELQEGWFRNVLVSVEKGEKDVPVYKIMLGPFPDMPTANSYKKSLKKKNKISGFVVNLGEINYK